MGRASTRLSTGGNGEQTYNIAVVQDLGERSPFPVDAGHQKLGLHRPAMHRPERLPEGGSSSI